MRKRRSYWVAGIDLVQFEWPTGLTGIGYYFNLLKDCRFNVFWTCFMLERAYYRSGTCLVCALALLIAVMTPSVLPSRTSNRFVQMIRPTRNYDALPTPMQSHRFEQTIDDNMVDAAEFGREAKNEKEEECFDGLIGLASVLFARPLSTSLKRPAKHAMAFGPKQSSPVLRC
jgi:hypothetical protein